MGRGNRADPMGNCDAIGSHYSTILDLLRKADGSFGIRVDTGHSENHFMDQWPTKDSRVSQEAQVCRLKMQTHVMNSIFSS